MNHKKLRRLYREERLQVRRRGGRKRAIGSLSDGGQSRKHAARKNRAQITSRAREGMRGANTRNADRPRA